MENVFMLIDIINLLIYFSPLLESRRNAILFSIAINENTVLVSVHHDRHLL